MDNIILQVEYDCTRTDKYIADNSDISRSFAAKLCEEGKVLVNGKPVVKKQKLVVGDCIEIELPPEQVYEDTDVIVVNKPQGMVVHPAPGNESGTLVNALLYHCELSAINGVVRPGIVHRIDKDTSGLLVVAKNNEAHLFLSEQIKEHSFTREYEAVVYGNLKNDKGTIDAPIGRHPVKRKQMAVTDKGSKHAITHYTVIERFGDFTHVRLRLETGRTHQIRVHMAYIGHPVAGDDVYGPKKVITSLSGQCLHAKKVGFIHPITNKYLEFESDLPDYFTKFLKGIR